MLKKIIKFTAHPRDNYPNIQIFGYHFSKIYTKISLKDWFYSSAKKIIVICLIGHCIIFITKAS